MWTENDASAYYTLPIVDVDGNIYALKYELQPPPDVTYSPGWKISIRSLTPDMLPRWTADTICGNSLSVVSSAGMIYEGLKSGCIAVREAATGNLLWSSYNSVNFASWTLRPESGKKKLLAICLKKVRKYHRALWLLSNCGSITKWYSHSICNSFFQLGWWC